MLWLGLIQSVEGLKGKMGSPRRRGLCLWTARNSSCSISSLRVLQPVLQTCGLSASIVSQVSSTKPTCLSVQTHANTCTCLHTHTHTHTHVHVSCWLCLSGEPTLHSSQEKHLRFRESCWHFLTAPPGRWAQLCLPALCVSEAARVPGSHISLPPAEPCSGGTPAPSPCARLQTWPHGVPC